MSKHKQEWSARGTAGHERHGQWAVSDETGRTIALVYDGERYGNLIAAAPELLAACERVAVRMAAKLERSGEAWMSDPDWQAASAAIAKATSPAA